MTANVSYLVSGDILRTLAGLLGERGVWVDQLTTLDPHPIEFPYGDGPASVYENVLFADNYYQQMDLLTYGDRVDGAYNRELTWLPGAYADNHSNVHVWYHATVDLATPTSYWDPKDEVRIDITGQLRSQWFVPEEEKGLRTGFAFSRVRKGSRLADEHPAGFGSPSVRTGYNQLYSSFGAGSQSNRALLGSVNDTWPNPLRLDVVGPLSLPHGGLLFCHLLSQAGSTDTGTVEVGLYADQDQNPDNGNEYLLRAGRAPTTGPNAVRTLPVAVSMDNVRLGARTVNLLARLSDSSRTRFIYSAAQPRTTADSVELALEGIADGLSVGARVSSKDWTAFIVEASADCRTWQPIITNLVAGSPFTYTQPAASSPASLFFRARVFFP